MKDGFVWCPHCGRPHGLADRFCPSTGQALDHRLHAKRPALPHPHPLVGAVLEGKYRILRPIGSGGMGEVFQAQDLASKQSVAVKIVSRASAEMCQRLRFEATAIASLYHPNICDVYDVGTMRDGAPYIVLEYLEGETLEQRLQRRGRLSQRRAVDVFDQVLSGLHAAHAAGILHRDLKPANVFLARGGDGRRSRVKLLDFGLAKVMGPGRGASITEPGSICGTPQYMSPEQLRAQVLDPRSDVFSVGVMLYEALAGRHPFMAESKVATAARILRDAPPRLRSLHADLSPSLDAVVARALAKDRAHRFESAAVMQLALGGTHWREATDSPAAGVRAVRHDNPSSEITAH